MHNKGFYIVVFHWKNITIYNFPTLYTKYVEFPNQFCFIFQRLIPFKTQQKFTTPPNLHPLHTWTIIKIQIAYCDAHV